MVADASGTRVGAEAVFAISTESDSFPTIGVELVASGIPS
jgi:hypothetical protein